MMAKSVNAVVHQRKHALHHQTEVDQHKCPQRQRLQPMQERERPQPRSRLKRQYRDILVAEMLHLLQR